MSRKKARDVAWSGWAVGYATRSRSLLVYRESKMRVYNVWHAVLDNDIVYMDMRGPRKILEERLRAQALQLD